MAATTASRSRVWRPEWPCPVAVNLLQLRHGSGDPTYRRGPDGAIWRGIRTPVGTATLCIQHDAAEGTVTGEAWGDGADWALEQLPRMLGADDDPSGFVPPPQLAQAWRRHQHWRVGATDLVMESLVPAIIEQKVTGMEALGAFRVMVHRFGERAPGPPSALEPVVRLWVQPSPEQLRAIPSWEWLRLPVDGARSRPIQHAARVATSLERAGRAVPGGVRPAAAHPARHRGLDECGDALPGTGRRRRRELRRLPRRRQRGLRADRGARGRRGDGSAARAVRRPPPPGPAPRGAGRLVATQTRSTDGPADPSPRLNCSEPPAVGDAGPDCAGQPEGMTTKPRD